MQCQNCGGQIADGAKFCPLCGKPVENTENVTQFCPNCGSKLAPNAAFCNGCGKKVNEEHSQNISTSVDASKMETQPTTESHGAESISTSPIAQAGKEEQEIDLAQIWDTLLSCVFKVPGLKVDRAKFLKEKLSSHCSKADIESAIAGKPTEIIDSKIIAKVANECIEEKQDKISGSLILKLASLAINQTGLGTVLTVLGYLGIKFEPANFVAYYFYQVQLLQEIAYLYSFPDMFDNTGKPLENTINVLTTCIAVTTDESIAKDKLKHYLQHTDVTTPSCQDNIKLDMDVLKRILPSLIMVTKEKFTYNSKILQNYLHVMYFGEIPQEIQSSNFIVKLLDIFGFVLSFPWGGISYKKFKKRPIWRRAINWIYAGLLCCAIVAIVSEHTEPVPPQFESITDTRDGHTYKALTIDGKKWIMENMQYDVPGSICENCSQNGRLYSFTEALDACPEGFSLPSQTDYESLMLNAKKNKNFVQALYELLKIDSITSGKSLKSKTSWNGSDLIGFNAIPTGFYSFKDSIVKRFNETTGFWTSDLTTKGIIRMKIENNEDTISFGSLNRNYGFSVRCVERAVSKEENDSILIKVAQQDLKGNKNTFDWPSESILKKMKKNVQYNVSENDIWNIYKEKKTNECIVFTAKLKKNIAGCKIGSSIEVFSVRHNNKMSYLANTTYSESDFCPWIAGSIDSNTFGSDVEFEWSEWGDYMLNIYASCGIQLSEFEEDEL